MVKFLVPLLTIMHLVIQHYLVYNSNVNNLLCLSTCANSFLCQYVNSLCQNNRNEPTAKHHLAVNFLTKHHILSIWTNSWTRIFSSEHHLFWSSRSVNRRQYLNSAFKLLWILSWCIYWEAHRGTHYHLLGWNRGTPTTLGWNRETLYQSLYETEVPTPPTVRLNMDMDLHVVRCTWRGDDLRAALQGLTFISSQ